MSKPNPVRVMHFIHSLKGGGAERQLAFLVSSSDPEKISHAVCCFNDQGKEEFGPEAEIFQLDRKNKFDFKFREILNLLADWDPDLVHNWLPNLQVNSFLPCLFHRKSRYLDSFHSVYRFDRPYRVFQALVYLLSDGLLSIAAPNSLFPPFRQIFALKEGTFIPNGTPVESIASAEPALPETLKGDPGAPLLLFVGRLSPEKNIPLLLQSVAQLASEGKDVTLLICGGGPSRERLEEQVRDLGVEGRVIFLGYVEEVYPVMKSCDLLILPSFREGMGNVIFEALAAELPVIASRVPALCYWFEDDQVVSLFDPHSLEELTASIRRELSRPQAERDQRREAGLRLVRDLDIQEMVRKYTDFYLGWRDR